MAEPVLLDAKGLKCPLPVLKARKAMKALAPGAVLRVLATDPGAVGDFTHFCAVTGHRLLEHRAEGDGVLVFEIEKAEEKA
ncbi:MAG TPA: sulfurtransferase TusA family protein [Stellaceae bacterium]|nr:sulfurtransferase TusA family protein [Stellaceae bacterium]